MTIENNLNAIRASIPESVTLVAVSKTMSNEAIKEAYDTGQRIFGENKVQEMVRKWESLPLDIQWHQIGHLQSNKVRMIAPFVSMIHSVDSYKLLKTIDEEAQKVGRIIPCLLQIHIAMEETKFGMNQEEVEQLIIDSRANGLTHVSLAGVMGMATFTDDVNQIKREFYSLHVLFQKLKLAFFSENETFKEISMGMSHDYLYAIENGSTLVRVGSAIFGERNKVL